MKKIGPGKMLAAGVFVFGIIVSCSISGSRRRYEGTHHGRTLSMYQDEKTWLNLVGKGPMQGACLGLLAVQCIVVVVCWKEIRNPNHALTAVAR